MIRSKDVNKELKKADDLARDDAGKDVGKAILKILGILVKLARDIRTNQSTIMTAQNIEPIKEERKTDGKKTDEKKTETK